MRFSILTEQGTDFCKRLEDLGHKCRVGEHSAWADQVVCIDGRPGDTPGVNNGLVAQAIYADPTYLPHFIHGLPEQDSVLLISQGVITGVFSLKEHDKIVPMDLGIQVPGAVTMLNWESLADVVMPAIMSSFRGVVKVSRGGAVAELVSSPGIWASLAEVYSLEKLFSLPPHVMTPKQPIAGAFAVLTSEVPEIPQAAIRHTLISGDCLYVSARGVTRKEVLRRIDRGINRLELQEPIYRLDVLKRR